MLQFEPDGVLLAPTLRQEALAFAENCRSQGILLLDLLDETLTCLRNSTINLLIHQNSNRQGFLGISCLTDYLVFQKAILPLNYLPLSIVTRENLDTYLNDSSR